MTELQPDLVEFFLRARGNILGSADKLSPLAAAIDGMMSVDGLPGFAFFVTGGGPVVWRRALLADHFGREVAKQLLDGTANAEQESQAVDVYVSALEQYLASMRDGSILQLYEAEWRRLAARGSDYNEPTLQKMLSKRLRDWVSVCWSLESLGTVGNDWGVVVRDTKISVSRSTFGTLVLAMSSNGLLEAGASFEALLQRELNLLGQSENEAATVALLAELIEQSELRALRNTESVSQLRQVRGSL